MSCTALSALQLRRWKRWLLSSHGVTELPGHVVYQCDVESTLYLTPMPKLPGFAMRQERGVEAIVATFEIRPGVRTIANLWGKQILDLRKIRRPSDLADAKQRALDAAREGRLWWGTERLAGFPDLTSICYIFEKDASIPGSIKKDLRTDGFPSSFDTTLELI